MPKTRRPIDPWFASPLAKEWMKKFTDNVEQVYRQEKAREGNLRWMGFDFVKVKKRAKNKKAD